MKNWFGKGKLYLSFQLVLQTSNVQSVKLNLYFFNPAKKGILTNLSHCGTFNILTVGDFTIYHK